MKFRLLTLLCLALMVAPLLSVFSQSQQQNEQTIRIGTAEVTLDVVVRDKKGRPVKDLKANEFEVYEDGVRQKIESFRLVQREAKAANETINKETVATTKKEIPRPATGEASIIALVFDRLRPESRILARRAALSYAEEGLKPADFTGVFLIDLNLRTVQPYTDQPQLVSQAVDRATTMATSGFNSTTEQTRKLSNQSASLDQQMTSAAGQASAAGGGRDSAGASAAGGEAGAAAVEQMFAQMNSRMMQTFEMLERNQQGYATIYALLAVVDSMRNLPGRKAIIFFSEGLAIPPAVQARFRSVVNAANRAQVSIYPIDAAGLRTESGTAETARELNSMAGRRMQQAHSSREDSTGPMTRQLERNEDLLRLNPETSLGQLADQTGGFLINNTNDLRAGMTRIDEDMRMHYALTYVPQRSEYDGRFRKITLKLKRSDLDVQTRAGYYAINPASNVPVLDYEVPALAALSAGRTASASTMRVGGMHFPETNRLGLAPLLVESPLTAFTFAADKEKKNYQTDFSIVVLVKNEAQQVVQKLSQHYALGGPLDKAEAARKGEVIFYREADLPPGRYTIEALTYDSPTGKASLRTSTLVVPEADETGLRMSSILLLKRADRLTAEEKQQPHPFHFGEVIIYPNLGEALRKAATKQLAFFVTLWKGKNSPAPTQALLEIRQQERVIGQTQAALPAADAEGRIQFASALPLDNLPPGNYELRLTVQDGQRTLSRTTPFVVEP
jgi:VWFA-related protein